MRVGILRMGTALGICLHGTKVAATAGASSVISSWFPLLIPRLHQARDYAALAEITLAGERLLCNSSLPKS